MEKAGTNESKFKSKIGEDKIRSKLFFGKIEEANISVDGHFEHNGKLYLLEIDSGNEAKLLVGQYILLDALYDTKKHKHFEKDNCVFLVVHYYNGYIPERTIKNLDKIKEIYNTSMEYLVFHEKDITDWEDLIYKIENK